MTAEAAPRPLTAARPTGALAGQLRVPGDKSISHRALMFGALAIGETHISGLLEGEDVLNTAKALRQLGVNITQKAAGLWEVQGVGIGGLFESSDVLDMGNSGTSTRLLMGRPMEEAMPWLKILIAFDLVFIVACTVAFPYTLEE